MIPGRFRAAVFDVDGVLVDTEPLWADAETTLLARRGLPFTEDDRRATVGRSIDATLREYAGRLGLAATAVPALRAELIEVIRPLYLTAATAMPGARDLVERLADQMPVAAASNTDRDLIEGALDRIGLLPAFTVLVTAQDVPRPKPAPDVYLEACARLGVPPTQAIAFEDSASGMTAARAAGLWCVAVPGGPHVAIDAADLAVASLADVLDLIGHSM
jgi:HAD superfamily hydrolase (TIGR01509 family)